MTFQVDKAASLSSSPKDRLSQVTNHISPLQNTSRKRRQKSVAALPPDYSDILSQISTLQRFALTPDPNHAGYSRQKAAGKLWVRERVNRLFDPGSVHEIGSVAGTVQWKNLAGIKEEPTHFIPSNNVQGFGALRRRKVVFTADDFSIRAGHADGALMQKTEGLSFTDLGGPGMHCTNGTIDNLAPDEEGCFEQLRTVLSYLPNHGLALPPVIESEDQVERDCQNLRTIIPRKKERMYNPRAIIETVLDAGSWFEIGALWGTTAITGLGRLDGRPVGIISLNCEVNAGALDAAGSQKLTRHLKFLDTFNIPLVQFVDVPGYAIGTVAERTATMRHGVALGTTYFSTTMPVFSVVTRRAYGVAGGIMLDCRDPRMRIAWPSGEWGSLPLEGGLEVGHAAELKKIEKESGKEAREQRYKELDEEYRRLMNPVRTANAFGAEEIVDPALTRRITTAWVKHVYEVLLPIRLMDRANGKIKPTFY
ncbi:hypothetical protein VE02_02165 [Pseudogymnoascus sp. 03VT05]|nr:hypothetical protein VE02_02165 [Pseudogymnoascus sp. 03VT05]